MTTQPKMYFLVSEEDITPIIENAVNKAFTNRNLGKNTELTEVIDEFITEDEAKKVLGRKTTWFYNARRSGELTAIKRANKWWYKKSDINEFIKGSIK